MSTRLIAGMFPTKKEKQIALLNNVMQIAEITIKMAGAKFYEMIPLFVLQRSLLQQRMSIRSTRILSDHDKIDAEIMAFMTRRKLTPKHKLIALMFK